MRVSSVGRRLITDLEGEILHVYADPIGLPTVGVGHLVKPNERSQYPLGKKITKAESQLLLTEDLATFEVGVLNSIVGGLPNQNEFDALVSLAFNIGLANFRKSSVLRHFNNGNKQKAADAFRSWNKAGGKVLPGLVTRRAKERTLFLTPFSPPTVNPDKPAAAVVPEIILPVETQKDGGETFFNKATSWVAEKKQKLSSIGFEPDISGTSKAVIGSVKGTGWSSLIYGFFEGNWLYILIGVALIALGVWYLSRSKDRVDARNSTTPQNQQTNVIVEAK